MTLDVLCVGGVNIDRTATAKTAVTLGSSNPITLTRSAGGVARNVAVALANLGHSSGLVSRVGADPDAEFIHENLAQSGVHDALIVDPRPARTSSYTSLIDPSGEMVVALADMDIHDQWTGAEIARVAGGFLEASWWFVECNLPEPALEHLLSIKPAGTRIALDTVSVAKAPRCIPVLSQIDLLFTNRREAIAVDPGLPGLVEGGGGARPAVRPGAMILTEGAAGARCWTGTEIVSAAPFNATVVDVTGGGDALIAGTLHGLLRGDTLAESLPSGMAAASLALEGRGAIDGQLSALYVSERLRNP